MNATSAPLHNNADNCESLITRLLHHAEADPDREALVTTTMAVTYAELVQHTQATVQRLSAAGISKNAIVGIRCPDDVQHFMQTLATIHIGATCFSIPSHETRECQASLIRQCRATHVINGDAIEQTDSEDPGDAIEQTDSEDPGDATPLTEARLLFSTSGTTGAPKLVVLHDSDLVAQAHRHIDSRQERFACIASMEHNFARRHRLYCLAEGASNLFLNAQSKSLVEQCLSLGVNVLHVSAFQAQELLAEPDIGKLSDIRLKLGGSHVPLQLRQQLRKQVTTRLQAGYGTTETGAIAFTDPDDSDAGESVGRPLAGIEVRVVAPDRKTLGAGERGELAIRCSGMFRGYLGNPEATAARLDDAWFYTGDTGFLDDEHRIHLCGRSDDMFVFNSMNVFPQDIESRICRFPNVVEALVLPQKSEVHGDIPVAFVVFAKGTEPDLPALQAYMRKHVGARCPRQFNKVEALPRNASGKISRHDALSLPEKSEKIRRLILGALNGDARKRLKPSAVAAFNKGNLDIPLAGTGMDSFARMELLVAIEVEYGVVITPEELAQFNTFSDICTRVLCSPPEETAGSSSHFPSLDTGQFNGAEVKTIRFFQRVFHSCPTVAQLNKALGTLEHRLTPRDIDLLSTLHQDQRLIPTSVAEKFQLAVSTWLQKMTKWMQSSGKQDPEPFIARRVAPSVLHFVGPGSPGDKKLLICFAPKTGRQLTIPNAVLMQHTDATRYDLLVIADSARESFRTGVPLLGRNIDEVIEWLSRQALLNDYSAIRTIGCSAGAFLAVIAGKRLNAELALSVAGRFHAERYPLRILGRIIATWRTFRNTDFSRVLMSYPADKGKSRDRIYAQTIAKLTGGCMVGLEFTNGTAGHHFLQPLVERGELKQFLDCTVFASVHDELFESRQTHVIFSLPAGRFRSMT